ncbi:MAG TPA: N-acetylneuraminate synthase [Pyrinomonadaceae bacterium]|nr:N-acetylneuraminate synthase [Pyrinomonadaceae bacterium]
MNDALTGAQQPLNVRIGDRLVGPGQPVFVIAEAGVNHNGDLKLARALIDVAVDAGADAVKFQTFHADLLAVSDAPKAAYQLETTDTQESQLEMLRGLELSADAHRELRSYCDERGIVFLSTPFDEQAVDMLDELGVPAFKISSGDLTNSPLLEYAAGKKKPMILSTGMSELAEVIEAVSVLHAAGCENPILLHCVTNYPAEPPEVNLRAMQTMRSAFNVPVGFSDHTEGIDVPLAAVALGACVIEKHFTLDRSLPGPDHRASLEPDELRQLVQSIRRVEVALGNGRKVPQPSEIETAKVARRSLVAATNIPAGATIEREMIVLRRPGTGLPPAEITTLLGRRARREIAAGSLLAADMFE